MAFGSIVWSRLTTAGPTDDSSQALGKATIWSVFPFGQVSILGADDKWVRGNGAPTLRRRDEPDVRRLQEFERSARFR